MSKDFKETLCLPQTDFPMRAGLAKKEPQFLAFWNDMDLNSKIRDKGQGRDCFILHDGPPYANGHIHIGTAFNKILKDFIPKFKSMRGYYCPYVPGWDTHGLPIELKVLKDQGVDKDSIDPVELRSRCTKYALEFLDIQRSEFRRLGVIGDWDNPYITLNPEYEAAQIGAFADIVEKGLVYKGKKPVYWCIDCQTALAAAEIEYGDETSPSIYVAYSMPEVGEKINVLKGKDVNVIVWTTTPWTLPASMAVAIHPSYQYAFVPCGDSVYLIAEELKKEIEEATDMVFGEPLARVKGKELEGVKAIHPFYSDRETPIVLADYVVLDTGTGCVHTAPGHGVEDYETGIRYGIDAYNPVDSSGKYVPETELVGGMTLEEGEQVVLDVLSRSGRLLGKKKIVHSYPHCWRCKKPVIFRSTDQWFVNVSNFRKEALDTIDKVQWIPEWGRDRIYNMVRDRSDWCISRQRVWGVPIPAFYCKECGKAILDPKAIRMVQEKVREKGCDVWWQDSPQDLIGDLAQCPECGCTDIEKDRDIMDVWFDSGVSHFAVLGTRPDLSWPADLYLEGSDQHRGWFQTSLLTSVSTKGIAPYKAVLTHGFIVDGEGKKMSKSIGNVVAPQEIIDSYGADILRLWVASTDYKNDIRISDTILKTLSEEYRRIRNTARFLLGNLSDFNPSTDMVPYGDLSSFDRWLLSKLNRLIAKVTKGYESYEFHIPTVSIHQFCVNELGSLYLDVAKDCLYADERKSSSRRSIQTVMWRTLNALAKMLAPVLSFTSEEIWQELKKIDSSQPESVFLTDWPEVIEDEIDPEHEEKWARIIDLKGAISRSIELCRSRGELGKSLEAAVTVVNQGDGLSELLSREEWERIAIVSSFLWVDGCDEAQKDDETGYLIKISTASGEKCPRCWRVSQDLDDQGLCPRCHTVM
ncbi:isoleucine--tRNA ligase [Dethiosulfovibrio salsuginis]|uniref:Isoleucine--tRNA ligase n=1 Tax=Dethiosulfovibrio salsuginis TaxID=561720 RepID=A0A1X7I4C6_9BACT|nr:isoleucine--tRNA ligase [Dethiosulfovibrio salsuginis]SMG09372.1 Isoleucyl-tRNA synthetase [Dethiosulfovibrio salsuginis]